MTGLINSLTGRNNPIIEAAGQSASLVRLKSQKSRFDQILAEAAGSHSDEKKLLDACYGMETLFIENLFDAMRKTVNESDFFGQSLAKDIFSDMLYSEYAKLSARSDQFGLAKQIYEQLSAQNTS
ncbi:MAG: rod-binding protein [Spirochaetes bacterium]|nr:rod-binding protein [Spirochaetota bacterium]